MRVDEEADARTPEQDLVTSAIVAEHTQILP